MKLFQESQWAGSNFCLPQLSFLFLALQQLDGQLLLCADYSEAAVPTIGSVSCIVRGSPCCLGLVCRHLQANEGVAELSHGGSHVLVLDFSKREVKQICPTFPDLKRWQCL